jgi:hypothetical protein
LSKSKQIGYTKEQVKAIEETIEVVAGSLTSKQKYAYSCPSTETLYGGAAGGGKSYLARASCILYSLQIPNFTSALFRRVSTSLLENHMKGAGGFYAMLQKLVDVNVCKVVMQPTPMISFINGSVIRLKHLNHINELSKIQGGEYGFIAFDEAIAFPKSALLEINTRIRVVQDVIDSIPPNLKNTLPRVMYLTNPVLLGEEYFASTVNYFKNEFVNAAKPFVVQPPDDLGNTRCYIPAKITDNPQLGDKDIKRLLGMDDKEKSMALLHGDWNAMKVLGGFDEWSPSKHIISPIFIPDGTTVHRGYDYGLAVPYAFLWYIRTNGEEISFLNGETFCPPKGSIIFVHEFYGGDEKDKGLYHAIPEQSENALKVEEYIKATYCTPKIYAGRADTAIWNKESSLDTIANQFAELGVHFVKSDKSNGSRISGLQKIKSMLAEGLKDMPEKPCLYFVDTCRNSTRTFPSLKIDKGGIDVESKGVPDHCYDVIRYVCYSGKTSVPMRTIRDGGLV